MKPSERDDLLARLDERSINTYKTVDKIEKHLESLNGHILDHAEEIAANISSIRGCHGSVKKQWTFLCILLGVLFGLKFTGVV